MCLEIATYSLRWGIGDFIDEKMDYGKQFVRFFVSLYLAVLKQYIVPRFNEKKKLGSINVFDLLNDLVRRYAESCSE